MAMSWYFVFFFLSGLCSIIYELVWLRLAMAQFGVTTALTSIVLSMFMGGLGLGAWAAGSFIRGRGKNIGHPLRLYALTELLIGVSALTVPVQLDYGHKLLERIAQQGAVSSASFYLASALCLAVTLLPWCACMGATIPFVMFAIRSRGDGEATRSFSFLYLANVVGAIGGALIAPILIELGGFHSTLRVAAVVNGLIAASAFLLSGQSSVAANEARAPLCPTIPDSGRAPLLLLFLTGLATMGMEVVWIRLFTPYVGPVVYAFATILASYLFATFIGSLVYRRWSEVARRENALAWCALVPLGMRSEEH